MIVLGPKYLSSFFFTYNLNTIYGRSIGWYDEMQNKTKVNKTKNIRQKNIKQKKTKQKHRRKQEGKRERIIYVSTGAEKEH